MAGGSKTTVLWALGGNAFIAALKFVAYALTGSGAMLSEGIHTLADVGNQALLLLGLQHAERHADDRHQYGYGIAAFFWALVSALGIFFLGAGVTLYHGVHTITHPPEALHFGWITWGTLGISLLIDGVVLTQAVRQINRSRPDGVGFFAHLLTVRDPSVVAVFMEDSAACLGVLFAAAGIGLTQWTGDPRWDGMASILIGLLLGAVALYLVRMNQRYLLGSAVDEDTLASIRHLLDHRASIESVHSVQTRWVGPSSFAYKAEIDFDGAWFANQLADRFAADVVGANERNVRRVLTAYTEATAALVAAEVDAIEAEITARHPNAVYILLEPHG
jgi:zinc transporter 9